MMFGSAGAYASMFSSANASSMLGSSTSMLGSLALALIVSFAR